MAFEITFEITDYVDVPARLESFPSKYTIDVTNKVLLLPVNFGLTSLSQTKFVAYPRFSGEVVEALSSEGVPVGFIGEGPAPTEILVKSVTADFLLPTLFFSYSLWTQNPHLLEIAVNVVSHYAVKALDSLSGSAKPNQAVFSAAVEITKEKTTRMYTYHGPVSGLSEVSNMIKAASEKK